LSNRSDLSWILICRGVSEVLSQYLLLLLLDEGLLGELRAEDAQLLLRSEAGLFGA